MPEAETVVEPAMVVDEDLTSKELEVPAEFKEPPKEVDRATIEKNVSAKLASVFGDEDDNAIAAPAEEKETTEAKPEKQETEAAAPAESDLSDDALPAPTLPAAYRRSLKAYEWTDEEIDANLQALGGK